MADIVAVLPYKTLLSAQHLLTAYKCSLKVELEHSIDFKEIIQKDLDDVENLLSEIEIKTNVKRGE